MGYSMTTVLGPRPSLKSELFARYQTRGLQHRLSYCKMDRSTTRYVSSSQGNDGNDGLTELTPWASFSRVQTYLDSISGDATIKFKNGDEWMETVGINCNKPNVCFMNYGGGSKPVFNALTNRFGGNTFENVGDNTYRLTGVAACSWIKVKNNLDLPYRLVVDQAACAATVGSWVLVGTDLYVRPHPGHPMDENTTFEFGVTNGDDAITIQNVDGCRVHGLISIGFGMNRASPITQRMGFSSAVAGTNEVVFSECEVYYASTHCFQQYSEGSGGIATFFNCKAGYTLYNGSGGETIYNAYTTSGAGGEVIFAYNETTYGTLPSHQWVGVGTGAPDKRGVTLFGHHGSLTAPALAWVMGHVTKANTWGAEIPAGIEGYQSAETNVENIAVVISNERFESNNKAGLGLGRSDFGAVRIGCEYLLRPRDDTAQCFALVSPGTYRAWHFNCIYDIDMTNYTSTLMLVNSTSNSNTEFGWWENCRINWKNTPFVWIGITHDGWSTNLGAQTEYSMYVFNCIITRESGTALLVSGNGNNSNVLGSNALFGHSTGTAAGTKWDGDASEVVLGASPALSYTPKKGDSLFRAGTPRGTTYLGYDFHGRRRRLDKPSIGPIDSRRDRRRWWKKIGVLRAVKETAD